jgi:hypothetical protein
LAGNPPGGKDARYFVLTHSVPREWAGQDSPFTFVTDGIQSALTQAQAVAGDQDVGRRFELQPNPFAHRF